MLPITAGLVPRHLEAVLAQQLGEEPVLVLNGARTVGKSTLLQRFARSRRVPVLDLDEVTTRQAVQADPTLFVTGDEPICIDEFQHVLPLLDAIKAELNRDLRPGRYVLTGSTRYATLPAASQSLTGIAVGQNSRGLRGQRDAIERGRIGAAQVPHAASTVLLDDIRMPGGDEVVRKHQVVARATADADQGLADLEAPTRNPGHVDYEQFRVVHRPHLHL